MKQAERYPRLQWSCRRGMKELDVLLERFLACNERQLRLGAWPSLEILLQAEDDQLWEWLQDPTRPEASGFQELLWLVRNGSANSH
jgi:antitoxin CptB